MKILFPTDEHYPFQDERARSVALQIARDFDPDLRIAGSDGIDFYTLSSFDRDPERITGSHLQQEINLWRAGQREWIDAAPNAEAKFIIGNHEDRLRRYLWKHPELTGLDALKLANLLGLQDLGIEMADKSGLEVLAGDLVIKHGSFVRKNSGYAAYAELEREKFSISVLTGHTHRGGTTYTTSRKGVVVAHECFCLCDLEPDYISNPNWQQGIVLATVGSGLPSIEAIPFYTYKRKLRAVWRGKEYIS